MAYNNSTHIDTFAQKVWKEQLVRMLGGQIARVINKDKNAILLYLHETITRHPQDSALIAYSLVNTQLMSPDSHLHVVTPECDAYVELQTHSLKFPFVETKAQRGWRDEIIQMIVQALESAPEVDVGDDLKYLHRQITTNASCASARGTHTFLEKTLIADVGDDLKYLHRQITTNASCASARGTHTFLEKTLIAAVSYPLTLQKSENIIIRLKQKTWEFSK
ncbi:MAG: hypothetical protein EXR81_02125 [Gammaproteobacteria bacterium]|nr:hypothetical protein [Gammaproteobacteria bacterium]